MVARWGWVAALKAASDKAIRRMAARRVISLIKGEDGKHLTINPNGASNGASIEVRRRETRCTDLAAPVERQIETSSPQSTTQNHLL